MISGWVQRDDNDDDMMSYNDDNNENDMLSYNGEDTERTASPLEIALTNFAVLTTVQELYERDPQALTSSLLRQVCHRGCQPGVV